MQNTMRSQCSAVDTQQTGSCGESMLPGISCKSFTVFLLNSALSAQCSGLSYSTLVRRCTLYTSGMRFVPAPFVTSINVYCPRVGRAFAQYDFRLRCLGVPLDSDEFEVVYANATNGVLPAPTMPPMPRLTPLDLNSSIAIQDCEWARMRHQH